MGEDAGDPRLANDPVVGRGVDVDVAVIAPLCTP